MTNMQLCLTNYDESIDNSDNVFYLGKWIKNSDNNTLNYHFNDRKYLLDSIDNIEVMYNESLESLAVYLNEIHSLSYNQRYWETLIGTWLMNYIVVMHDRFKTIVDLKKLNYSGTYIVSFRKEKLPLIYDYYDFATQASSDESFNYHLFLDIMDFLDINYKSIKSDDNFKNTKNKVVVKTIKNKVISLINKISLLSPLSKQYISATQLNIKNILKIILLSKFKIMPLYFDKINQPNIKDSNRKPLLVSHKNKNTFENYFYSRIIRDIPVAYLENYTYNVNNSKKKYPVTKNNSILFSKFQASSETFKFFLADFSINNKYYGYQHGGYYGMLYYLIDEYYEIKISDKYCIWGENEFFLRKSNKIVSVPVLKFTNLKKVKLNNLPIKNIIYLGANFRFYLYELQTYYIGVQWKEYYNLQEIFFNNIANKLKNKLKNRIYGYHAPDKKIELSKKINWINYDEESKLEFHFNQETILIIDYPGTTFLEALYTNTPSILFWDKTKFLMRDDTEEDLDELRKVDILFNSPLEAVFYLNSTELSLIKENWYKKETQSVINLFLQKYAFCKEDWIDEFIKKLNEN